jgi:hypothetical protein
MLVLTAFLQPSQQLVVVVVGSITLLALLVVQVVVVDRVRRLGKVVALEPLIKDGMVVLDQVVLVA